VDTRSPATRFRPASTCPRGRIVGTRDGHRARAPVAQRIQRRPPEPDRLSVVAARVEPRAKRAESYALRFGACQRPSRHGIKGGPSEAGRTRRGAREFSSVDGCRMARMLELLGSCAQPATRQHSSLSPPHRTRPRTSSMLTTIEPARSSPLRDDPRQAQSLPHGAVYGNDFERRISAYRPPAVDSLFSPEVDPFADWQVYLEARDPGLHDRRDE